MKTMIKMILIMIKLVFQDADLIISRIDPDRAGLLSFPAFCRGVATLMGSELEIGHPGEQLDNIINCL